MALIDRREALRAALHGLSGGALQGGTAAMRAAPDRAERHWVSVFDAQFAGGAKGDGVTDDSAAISAAATAGIASGRPIFMPGAFAVANLDLSGGVGQLTIVGDPVFNQAQPNTPCLRLGTATRQRCVGARIACTVIPHRASSKHDPANVAIDLTGYSGGVFEIRLGKAERHDEITGRFHTVVHAESVAPFHYGNRVRLMAHAVPAPHRILRYGNRGAGVGSNPNINLISAWLYALDTVAGDVLIDVADTTQTIIAGPTLIEACPNAVGIRAGNFTTIRDVWFEALGTTLEFVPTRDTVPNDCRVERCYFSGANHRVRLSPAVAAPPRFVDCLGNPLIQREAARDTGDRLAARVTTATPLLRFIDGGGILHELSADTAACPQWPDRTIHHRRYRIEPSGLENVTISLLAPPGHHIEHAQIGLRDAAGAVVACALGDDPGHFHYHWRWASLAPHLLNVRLGLVPVA